MKTIILLVVTALFSMFSAGLGAVEIGEFTDPAKPINIEAGKIIIITLASNKTTGYAWELAKDLDTNVVDFMKTEYIPHETVLVGSGGVEVWSFRAMGQGQTNIEFKYVRPWEKLVEPAKVISFKVNVTEPVSEEEEIY